MRPKIIKKPELDAWKSRDPKGFELQKRRQESYRNDKLARKAVSAAALVRQPEDTEDVMHDVHAGISDQNEFKEYPAGSKLTGPIASPQDADGGKKSGNTCNDTGSIADLAYLAKQKLFKGHYNKLFIELCCESGSVLSESVCGRALAIRITKEDDMSRKDMAKALHGIIRTARHLGIEVHACVSIPCIAGCPWRYVNASKERETGDPILIKKLIDVAEGLVKHTLTAGGQVYWESAKTSSLWKEHSIDEFLDSKGCKEVDVSIAAVGMRFVVIIRRRLSTRSGAYARQRKLSLITSSRSQLNLQMSNLFIALAEGLSARGGIQRN